MSGAGLAKLERDTRERPPIRRGEGPQVEPLSAADLAQRVIRRQPVNLPRTTGVALPEPLAGRFAAALERGYLVLPAWYELDRYRNSSITLGEDERDALDLFSHWCQKATRPYAGLWQYVVSAVPPDERVERRPFVEGKPPPPGFVPVRDGKDLVYEARQLRDAGDPGGEYCRIFFSPPAGQVVPAATQAAFAGLLESIRYRGNHSLPLLQFHADRVHAAGAEKVMARMLELWDKLALDARQGRVFATFRGKFPEHVRTR
jgi:hypothetical protein